VPLGAPPFFFSCKRRRRSLLRKLTLTTCALCVLGGTVEKTAKADGSYNVARKAVCYYFGSYCDQAMRVSRCETGGTYDPGAANGQYLGIFQMGSHERATYGHGPSVWAQARAAFRYFVASGRDWSPWTCRWAAYG